MSEENQVPQNVDPGMPGAEPTTPSAPAAQPAGTLNLTSEQLKERLGRAQSSYLQENFGTRDPAEIQAKMERLAEMEAAEEQRRREQLSEQERLQADLEAERAKAAQAQEERDAIAFENHVTRVCAELGVKNVEFAMWEITRKAEEMEDEETFDAKEHLQGMLDNSQQRAALGIAEAIQTQPTGATTTPAAGEEPTPQGQPTNDGSAFEMNAQEWAEKKARLGIQ